MIQENMMSFCLARVSVNAGHLMAQHPPKVSSRNKRAIFDLVTKKPHTQPISISRWKVDDIRELPLPSYSIHQCNATKFNMRQDVFMYEPNDNNEIVEWYINFADSHLFVAYASELFAQDEIQVAEHPSLGAVKEMLERSPSAELIPLTRAGRSATPILIRNIERRCAVSLGPNAAEGRPRGIYGNNFSTVSAEAIVKATKLIDPPTITNMICMAALGYRRGVYTREQIQLTFCTAFTAFSAAKYEASIPLEIPLNATATPIPVLHRVRIHTGNWGTGAFGNDRVLMALIQMLAARLAKIDEVTYHSFDAAGTRAYNEAMQLMQKEIDANPNVCQTGEAVVEFLEAKKFIWGESDGN